MSILPAKTPKAVSMILNLPEELSAACPTSEIEFEADVAVFTNPEKLKPPPRLDIRELALSAESPIVNTDEATFPTIGILDTRPWNLSPILVTAVPTLVKPSALTPSIPFLRPLIFSSAFASPFFKDASSIDSLSILFSTTLFVIYLSFLSINDETSFTTISTTGVIKSLGAT